MFKRRESKFQSENRRQAARKSKQKRRLTLEGLEQRQLLAAGITPTIAANLPVFTGPRNVGSVQAFQVVENEIAGQTGLNDVNSSAMPIPLGTAAGKQSTIDITGGLPLITVPNSTSGFRADIDVFSFELRAGDILDIATLGSAGGLTVQYANGQIWFATDLNVGAVGVYPANSPLQTGGNNTASMVVPEDGTYFLTIAPINSLINYTVGLRVYRPVTEQLNVGQSQIIFLDFDGGVVDPNVFNEQFGPGVQVPGLARFLGLDQSLQLFGLEAADGGSANRLIDATITELQRIFANVGINGTNGNFATTGVPGDYGFQILNSRDHAGLISENDPRVTRLLIGGTNAIFGPAVPVFGVSESVDLGNFDISELVAMPLELYLPFVQSVPIAPSRSVLDGLGVFLGAVAAHELGHSFGLWHTDANNTVSSTIDAGGSPVSLPNLLGVGLDGIFGTLDDSPTEFRDDFFSPAEFYFGRERVPATVSHVLSTGLRGGGITGRVFNDLNRNGNGNGDTGLSGVTVFADINGNGTLDLSEPKAVTAADGTFTLTSGTGAFNIIVISPPSFTSTTPTSRSATVTVGGSTSGVDFGFARVQSDVTGFIFGDNNGDGLQDTTDRGVAGVYVYLDLDGDDRPDLGEPSAISGADGSYRINFPGPGTYTIREVLTPGFVQTFPASGEHTVVFNGTALTNNFNFGNLPSRDYGDAPNSFGTTRVAGGPSHGITAGLSLGTAIDREIDGQPTADATGDDANGLTPDDEDGVRLVSPLGPGAAATFEVTTTNTTGNAAYLQGWIDFNGNGVFDSSEKVISNRLLGSGTTSVTVNVPANATLGNTFARFRYSQTLDLGPGGDADTGEVEDYRFTILAAAQIVNNDTVSVSRNTSMTFDVLANDFNPNNTLFVNNLSTSGTQGTVRIAADGRNVIYTPPNNFIGQDSFGYTVRNEFGVVVDANGNPVVGQVTVNVTFQSNSPIAIDDSFVVPQGSVNRALNVLDNDIPSLFGGLSIASITPGNAGGTVRIIGGGQSLSYTPLPGFNGTEQFTYSVIDGNGTPSSAQVTVNLSPGPVPSDDKVAFTFQTLDVLNNTPISSIQAGQTFKLRVFVEDVQLNVFGGPQGVASAFLDVLYTDELVTPVDSDPADNRPFDITFGALFNGGSGSFQQLDSFSPGLLDDIGATQSNIANPTRFTGPRELFTVTMRATAPGVAIFQADPADNLVSDTIVIDSDVRVPVSQLRLGRSELVIGPQSTNFTSAIDDAFRIVNNSGTVTTTLDVQANDLIRRQELSTNPLVLGAPLDIIEFGILQGAALGNAVINPGSNVIRYTPNIGANGLDSFTYFIVTEDGTRSTAEVSVTVGNAAADDLVGMQFSLTDGNGNAVTNPSINVGDRFGVRITVDDLRGGFDSTLVFAAFLDVLYDADLLRVADTSSTDRYDFDVVFGSNFDVNAGVGSAVRPGIIDEFGTQDTRGSIPPGAPREDPRTLATLFFVAKAAGTTTIVGSPADASPNQDTLLLDRDDPVPKERITYGSLPITIGGGEGEFPLHNTTLAADVNGDGVVSPIDALNVINEMNRQLLAQFEGESPISVYTGSRFFTDVNGDKRVTAGDALMVINYLNTQSLLQVTGEAESVVTDMLPRSQNSVGSPQINDAAISTLSEDLAADVADGDIPQSGVAVSSSSTADHSADNDEDDDDDVLSLLADDVAGVWS